MSENGRLGHRFARLTASRPGAIVAVTVVITLLFLAAIILIPVGNTNGSLEAGTTANAAEHDRNDQLPPRSILSMFRVGAQPSGTDAQPAEGAPQTLSKALFADVIRTIDQTAEDDRFAPYVYTVRDPAFLMDRPSFWSLPHMVQAVMDGRTPVTHAVGWSSASGGPGVSFEDASEAQFQDALGRLLELADEDGDQPLQDLVSGDLNNDDGSWSATSFLVFLELDFASATQAYAIDVADATDHRPHVEELQLDLRDALENEARTAEWDGFGAGITEAVDEGLADSFILIPLSITVIGIIMWISLRSWRDFWPGFIGLPMLAVWLLGSARVMRIPESQFTALLPLMIMAIGVDFAIHAMRRYQTERSHAKPGPALRRSMAAFGPALLLATVTTAIAFAATGASRIDQVRHFGTLGAVSVIAAFWVLGVFTPNLRSLLDRRMTKGRKPVDNHNRIVAGLAGGIARRPLVALAILAALTVPLAASAASISTDFKAEDFFDPDSRFIQGIKAVEREYPAQGEPAYGVIEGDLHHPQAIARMGRGIDELRNQGLDVVEGANLVDVLRLLVANGQANDWTGHHEDGLPTTRDGLRSALATARENGVHILVGTPGAPTCLTDGIVPAPSEALCEPGDRAQRVLGIEPAAVRAIADPGAGRQGMTVVPFSVPAATDLGTIKEARDAFYDSMSPLSDGAGDYEVRVSGSPVKALEMTDTIRDTLTVGLAFSVGGALFVVWAALRSLRMALITLLPIVVLVTWLFGLMNLFGFSVNVVSATIATLAVGVGVDYSIHFVERVREARGAGRDTAAAIREAAGETGTSLLASATTTALGFMVLALAPMPMFVTFGIVMATMAVASFVAVFTMVPPLLALFGAGVKTTTVDPGRRALHRTVAVGLLLTAVLGATLVSAAGVFDDKDGDDRGDAPDRLRVIGAPQDDQGRVLAAVGQPLLFRLDGYRGADWFVWNFGDGATVEGAAPRAGHAFTSPGAFRATVTSTGSFGEVAHQADVVVREALRAEVGATVLSTGSMDHARLDDVRADVGQDLVVGIKGAVRFDAAGSDGGTLDAADARSVRYHWYDNGRLDPAASGPAAERSFLLPGVHTVHVMVRDPSGATAAASRTVQVVATQNISLALAPEVGQESAPAEASITVVPAWNGGAPARVAASASWDAEAAQRHAVLLELFDGSGRLAASEQVAGSSGGADLAALFEPPDAGPGMAPWTLRVQRVASPGGAPVLAEPDALDVVVGTVLSYAAGNR